ncbi:MAG TPA: dTDP-4-dehydrorhamnose 3,5-epimerase [Chthoniobacterales bacterium]|nr:dTDP-4-dehydrorhamnose 3,5-epimerase [Chthoniobacterales bacterium]
MIFHETKLGGAFIVELDRKLDERGFFARAFCAKEFQEHDLPGRFVQANMSFNHKKGTLRGMHYQVPPASEPKFIRCINGAIWDVIIDMRPESPTYLQHFGVELTAENRKAIYVPDMFAHGNQALTDGAELLYLVGEFYTPGCERGVRFDDPAIGIEWPLPVTVISEKDAQWPLLNVDAGARQPR